MIRIARLLPRVLPALFALCALPAVAAPVITDVFTTGQSPPHAQVGTPVFIQATGLTGAVQVFFSDGTNPTVAAAAPSVDLVRGILNVRVPAGAVTGNMKITAAGVDSPLYYFRVDAGSFTQGTDVVSGQVLSGASGVANAMVVLLQDTGCDNQLLWDYTLTNGTGNYTLHGVDNNYFILVFPPLAANLAVDAGGATLSGTPATVNFSLVAGTQVTGRVVDAAAPSTGIANVRLSLDANGSDFILTDATGNFSVHLLPGNYKINYRPAPGAAFAGIQLNTTVNNTPTQNLGNIGLTTGVRVSGTVTRASDGKPLPNVRLDATVSNTCCTSIDRKQSAGDGSYSFYLPASQSYKIQVQLDDSSGYVDTVLDPYVVGVSNQVLNFPSLDAAIITGTVTDRGTGLPLDQIGMQANVPGPGGTPVTFTKTCTNGNYRMRVPPSVAGYQAIAAFGQTYNYAVQGWNGNSNGTFYPCEGTAVTSSPAGNVTSGINFALVPSGAITGTITSQTSSCTLSPGGTNYVSVDDGGNHNCSMGTTDFNPPPGQYRVTGLPATVVGNTRRACIMQYNTCYNQQVFPAYNAFSVIAGSDTSNINFCVSDAPTQQITGVRLSKSGGNLQIIWNTSTDPNHSVYQVRGALTAKPTTAPGNFPNDPVFASLSQPPVTNYATLLSTPYVYFLITDVSPSSNEGPSGSYGH
jgi:hypothetical protein